MRPATVAGALEELHAAGLAAVDVDDQDVTASRWSAVPAARDPLLESVDLHGAHYRHTTPEMAARAVDAIQQRLTALLQVAQQTIEKYPNRSTLRVFS